MNFYSYLVDKAKFKKVKKIVVGAIILDKDKNVLILTRKKDDFMGGIDELPSGNMEKDEDILCALKREIKEETNLDLKEIEGYINSFEYISGSGEKVIQYNFYVKVKCIDNIRLTEHDAYKWSTLDNAMNNESLTEEVKECLKIFEFNYINKG